MDTDWDINGEEDDMADYYDDFDDEYDDKVDDYEKDDTMADAPQLYCHLCDFAMSGSGALIAHVLSSMHNKLLRKETASPKTLLLRKLLKNKRNQIGRKSTWTTTRQHNNKTFLTKRLKYLSPPEKLQEIEDGEIEDGEIVGKDDEYTDDDSSDVEDNDSEAVVKKLPKPSKLIGNECQALVPAVPTTKIDLRNKLNELKEKQNEERKAEKRKKKNIRTREAKKRNKKMAKEEKKRIEEALEALEEEDENIAFMKHTMGFSKFQSTKRSYF